MKELTRAEEEIMQILWDLKRGVVHDVIEKLPEPKPAYNTVSTIVRILEQKGFVDHKAYGRTYEYFPVITRKEYTQKTFGHWLTNYFSDSYPSLASFFARDKKISVKELEEIRNLIDDEIRIRKIKTRK